MASGMLGKRDLLYMPPELLPKAKKTCRKGRLSEKDGQQDGERDEQAIMVMEPKAVDVQIKELVLPGHYVANCSADWKQGARGMMVDRLFEAAEELNLHYRVLYLAANLTDQFSYLVSKYCPGMKRINLSAVGYTCIWIAQQQVKGGASWEFGQKIVELMNDMPKNKSYDLQALVDIEKKVKSVVGSGCECETAADLVVRYAMAAQLPSGTEPHVFAKFLTELALTEFDLSKYGPKMLTAACVWGARSLCLDLPEEEDYPPELERISGLTYTDIMPCVQDLWRALKQLNRSENRAMASFQERWRTDERYSLSDRLYGEIKKPTPPRTPSDGLCLPADYPESCSDEFKTEIRGHVVDRMMAVSDKFGIQTRTLNLAVTLKDSYLYTANNEFANSGIPRFSLLAVGFTCLYMASSHQVPLSDLTAALNKEPASAFRPRIYTEQDIIAIEKAIIDVVASKLTAVWLAADRTAADFADRFAAAGGISGGSKHRAFVDFLLELAMTDFDMAKYTPKTLAAAAVWETRQMWMVRPGQSHAGEEPFSEGLGEASGLSEEDVAPCAKDLARLLMAIGQRNSIPATMLSCLRRWSTTERFKWGLFSFLSP
uniref:Cyclin N-terminal domain-containing protein n=1 Tax=Vitrella brassicaformis TaxID=1169539 RepID=A0A7S1PDT3_9ALVE|mmetsp:Transcript_6993/g.16982  ORF Transcript_6993/g.16982 Transcript_6993/m.16982 type:complete len:601 (+) Transcript_6993:200-2002(+)